MDQALIKIGLPVKCHTCEQRGYIKPGTNYGGWYKYKPLRKPIIWYCPTEAEKIRQYRKGIEDRYATPAPSPQAVAQASTEEELYKLLD